jgi:hypothetical protein
LAIVAVALDRAIRELTVPLSPDFAIKALLNRIARAL